MASIFERLGYQAIEKAAGAIRPSAQVTKYARVAGNLLNGNFDSAANGLMDRLLGTSSLSGLNGLGGVATGNGNVALAGSTWGTLYSMYQEAQAAQRQRSNLWHVVVEPIGKINPPRINLLATEFNYNGVQLGYDTKKIGSGFTQVPTGADPIELSLTTYDVDGEIQAWFEQLKNVAVHEDGTFGLPTEYANKFTITHGAIEEGHGYTKSFVLLPVSCQVTGNRKVEEFTELNLTFTQYESFGAL